VLVSGVPVSLWPVPVGGAAVGAGQAPRLRQCLVHHVHLNSVDPAKARRTTRAVRRPRRRRRRSTASSGEDRQRLPPLTKVAAPPQYELTGPQTAVCISAGTRPTRGSTTTVRGDGLEIAQMWTPPMAARGHVERHAAGAPDAGADPRAARERRQPTRQGASVTCADRTALIENAASG